MFAKIILLLLWTIAAAAGLGAFVMGTSAFDRYVMSDSPGYAGSMLGASATGDNAAMPRHLNKSSPARRYNRT